MGASRGRMCAATFGAACAAVVSAPPAPAAGRPGPMLRPGDRLGKMTLVRQPYTDGIVSIFRYCDPLILAPALYHRHCTVPRVARLFIGYGDFEATYPALVRAWQRQRWELHVDGRPVALPAFGTDDRTLFDFPPGTHRDSILREWQVALVNPTRGRHLVRYVTRAGRAKIDVTFTVWVR